MITLNDIIINQNTHKDILRAVYSGSNFTQDSRKLAIFRTSLLKWDELKIIQKKKTINDLIALNNVFDEYHLARFLLSNLPDKTELLINLFIFIRKAHPEYLNINGKNIVSIDYYNDKIEYELQHLYD